MEKYKPMLKEPTLTDKNWINYEKGGYNYCIMINSQTGSVLPNCTGWAWGRWRMLLGKKPNLSVNQAEVWFTHKDNYERGQIPKLGAIICWSKGNPKNYKDGAGHIAVVEEIKEDGSIVLSMSGAHSKKRFWLETIKPPYKYGIGYNLQGFIYPPIEYEEPLTHYLGVFPKLPFKGYLGRGDKGEQVKNLQRLINWINGCSLSIDGSFGPATLKEVKKYQKNYGLVVDGKFGPASLKKAKTIKK